MVEPLAKKYKDRPLFGIVDMKIFEDVDKQLHLQIESTPAFAIWTHSMNRKYPMNDRNSSSFLNDVSSFVSQYFSGQLQPTIESAPMPEEPQGPIVEVVANNYHTIVHDATKDVLIEF